MSFMIMATYAGLASIVFCSTDTVPLYVLTFSEEGMTMCNTEMPPRYKKIYRTFGAAAGILI